MQVLKLCVVTMTVPLAYRQAVTKEQASPADSILLHLSLLSYKSLHTVLASPDMMAVTGVSHPGVCKALHSLSAVSLEGCLCLESEPGRLLQLLGHTAPAH